VPAFEQSLQKRYWLETQVSAEAHFAAEGYMVEEGRIGTGTTHIPPLGGKPGTLWDSSARLSRRGLWIT